MITNEKKNDEAAPLDDGALDSVSGGAVIPRMDIAGVGSIPDTVIDDATLKVLGRAGSLEEAMELARKLGVSTERITWSDLEQMRDRLGSTLS